MASKAIAMLRLHTDTKARQTDLSPASRIICSYLYSIHKTADNAVDAPFWTVRIKQSPWSIVTPASLDIGGT